MLSAFVIEKKGNNTSNHSFLINYLFKLILFVNSYLLIWTLTGIALLLVWSMIMNILIAMGYKTKQIDIIYGILLIISGTYQFSPLKNHCIGYCESPLSFFMRRWKSGTSGASQDGYLPWIVLPWMLLALLSFNGVFRLDEFVLDGIIFGIIFAEKIWSRGLLAAKMGGIIFMTLGLFIIIFAINGHIFIGMVDNNERSSNVQSMDMNGMMDMEKGSTYIA